MHNYDFTWILATLPGAVLLLLVLWNHAKPTRSPVVVELNEVELPLFGPVDVRFERMVEYGPLVLRVTGMVKHRPEVLALAEETLEGHHTLRVILDGTPYESAYAWFEGYTLSAGAGALVARVTLVARDPQLPADEPVRDAPASSSSPVVSTTELPEEEAPPVTLSSGKGDLST